MIDTTFERWAEQNAGLDAELEAAGGDPFKTLGVLVRASGTHATFDLGASFERPCTVCGTTLEPRDLIQIGTYLDGSELRRPVCEKHMVLMHLHGAEPDNRQLQILTAYEVARRADSRRAPTRLELEAAIAERTSGLPRGLSTGWEEV